ncbi:unnamed protein product [Calypogeia fissa]
MSTATVCISHPTAAAAAGVRCPAQTVLNRTDSSGYTTSITTTVQSSGRRGSVGHGPTSAGTSSVSSGNRLFYGPYTDLGSKWTGSESRLRLQASCTAPRGVNCCSRSVLVVYGGPIGGGLIDLRRRAKPGRLNPNLVHEMHCSAPRRNDYSILPGPVSDTRLAYGYYLGPAYGYGGGFGSGSFLVFVVLGFIAVQAFQSLASGRSDGGLLTTREKVSVLKLQVGLLGFARTLQNDLERISDRADTSTSRGLHYVLTETVLALLRQPDMCILGTSFSEVKRGVEAGERRFNQLSLEERGKFDEETLVNVDGNRKRAQEKIRGDGFSNEYIVVTLLVAADGDYNLPAIYDNNDLKEALKKLGSIPADSIQGVEILWTPQDKSDSLTERDLLRNYPLLKSL